MENKEIDINELISKLNGSCLSIDEACEEMGFLEEDLTTEQIEHIETEILKCDSCGWWSEAYDLTFINGDNLCSNCNEE
jgi:hypothetical protein